LASPKVLSFGNKKKNLFSFCISLTYSYLCKQNQHNVMDIKKQFAQKLMDIKAIKLQPNDPFTWASGWKSPIYTDNRKTLGHPSLRSFVKLELCHVIQENFPEADAVAGVATGAIAQGALVAEELGLPYCYVRPKPKDHGMGNQVEGEIKKGSKVIVVEDLISTGGSSLKAVAALREYGVEVIGMVASFTYGFPVAEEAFREAGVKLITLSNYDAVIEQAAETGYIKEEEKAVLAEWRKDPSVWGI
jgi:orotate phosphoribosyltransferase